MMGNFFELGPYPVVDIQSENIQRLSPERNLGSWNRIFGLIFLDNPIGLGCSIAATPEEIPRNQPTVAKHLFAAITGFWTQISRIVHFISLVRVMLVSMFLQGYYILKQNMRLPEAQRVNLKGVAIGNGLTDPITQVKTHAINAYFSGFINERQRGELEKAQWKAVEFVKMGNWSEATNARS
ncbi:hypothetical protein MANES_03G140233v8 [Manihot esculenta]|uniref:Uncharacterized protein n=1 Tax=Manihot esculenta TaxID=3983 RepID=A0ACB7I0V2_MANES|nr:hypothetical protein MANES_03G140233v8 [Manihot esculenta]